MRVLRRIFTAVLLLCSMAATAQQMELFVNVEELLPADVEVQGATQGFAIYGRYGFSMHDKGQCVVVDMRRGKYVSTFIMEGNTGHCNNASFGKQYRCYGWNFCSVSCLWSYNRKPLRKGDGRY